VDNQLPNQPPSTHGSATDNNVDLTALARYTPNNMTDVEFGLARKVRSPNLYERYTWSTWGMAALMNNFVGDGNGYVGNMDLKPEKAYTASFTFDWHAADRSWELKATPYYTHVDDYIDAVRCNFDDLASPNATPTIALSFCSTPTSRPASTASTSPAACRWPRPAWVNSACAA
jgi:iron complex outermembrane receptor protein